jgi:putative endonuclease
LRSRFDKHNKGKNASTKSGIPWELIYYEAYQTKDLALKREIKLKAHGKGFAELKKRIIGLK